MGYEYEICLPELSIYRYKRVHAICDSGLPNQREKNPDGSYNLLNVLPCKSILEAH